MKAMEVPHRVALPVMSIIEKGVLMFGRKGDDFVFKIEIQ